MAHVAVLTQSSRLTSMILSVEIPFRITSDWSGRFTMMSMATGRTFSSFFFFSPLAFPRLLLGAMHTPNGERAQLNQPNNGRWRPSCCFLRAHAPCLTTCLEAVDGKCNSSGTGQQVASQSCWRLPLSG